MRNTTGHQSQGIDIVNHTPHVVMINQSRIRPVDLPLNPIMRIGIRQIKRTGGMGNTLQGHINARVVHHREHRDQPLTLGSNQFGIGFIKHNLTCGRRMQTHLFFDPRDAHASRHNKQ